VEFRILGSLEIWSGGRRVTLGGRRAECVLATLLLDINRVVPVARLVDAGWDERPPPTAAHQVRKTVAELRRRLPGGPDLIHTDGAGYRIVLSEDQLDLSRFDALLRRAREATADGQPDQVITHLRQALDIWRGPAFAGLDGLVITAAATVLDERRLAATDQLMDLCLAAGEARELVAALRAQLAEHPLREKTRGQLMVALYRCGRQAEALHLYDQGRRVLAEQLGVDPGPDLMNLHERMLRNDPALLAPAESSRLAESLRNDESGQPAEPAEAGPATSTVTDPTIPDRPSTLPYDVPDFVGRETELVRIQEWARTQVGDGLAILTIDGMPGVGKTSLMLHAARRVAEGFPDGQLFIDLHGLDGGREPMRPAEALYVLLYESGVPGERMPEDVPARAALWRAQTAHRKLLILLDNAADAAQVRPLLPGAAGCLVMITSRSRPVGLDGILPISLELPPRVEAIQLVTRILGARRVAREPENADALVAACGGLPLAIRVAATRLHNRPQWSIGHLVDRLADRERRLTELSVDDRSVAAAISLSYDALDPDSRRTLGLLGLLPEVEFDAYAVAALADTPVAVAERRLEDLVDARLVTLGAQGHYQLHDIIRSFARAVERTESDDSRAAARRRLFDHYLRAADAAAERIQPGRARFPAAYRCPPGDVPPLADRAAAMTWFDTECQALLAAVQDAAADGLHEHACELPRTIAYYLQLRGRMPELSAVLKVGLAAARHLGDGALEVRGLINLSIPHWHSGRFDMALDCAERALTIARRTHDRAGEGIALGRVGTLLNSFGRYPEAMRCHRQALEVSEQVGDRRETSRALSNMSVALSALGRYDEARSAAWRAVRLDHELADGGSEVVALVNLATAQIGLADYDAAQEALRGAQVLASGDGTPNGEAVTLARYADLFRRIGRYDEAIQHGQDALDILWRIRRPAIAAEVENTLGRIHHAGDDYDLALERHKRARALAERVGFRIELARALDGMAHATLGLLDRTTAIGYWQQALAHFDAMGLPEADLVRRDLDGAGH
jgi:DNA-binding SARP family transcriptional activator